MELSEKSTPSLAIPEQSTGEQRGRTASYTLPDKIAVVISSLALILAALSLCLQLDRDWHIKTIDLMCSFENRYDTLVWQAAKEVKTKEDAEVFYSRYWGLQMQQYEYWKEGLIDDEVYAYWMGLRRAACTNENLNPLKDKGFSYSYMNGWVAAKKRIRADLCPYYFQEFMDEVMDPKGADIRSIFAKYKDR